MIKLISFAILIILIHFVLIFDLDFIFNLFSIQKNLSTEQTSFSSAAFAVFYFDIRSLDGERNTASCV